MCCVKNRRRGFISGKPFCLVFFLILKISDRLGNSYINIIPRGMAFLTTSVIVLLDPNAPLLESIHFARVRYDMV